MATLTTAERSHWLSENAIVQIDYLQFTMPFFSSSIIEPIKSLNLCFQDCDHRE
jgi:hypothetical protein